jgi:hypothetical protein
MISKKEIVEFINDRDILIVGSAVDLSNTKIEFDGVVVRLNTSRRWGECDIWFLNTGTDDREFHKSKNAMNEKYIIRGTGTNKGFNMKKIPLEWYDHTHFWEVEAWEAMVEEIKIPRPTTGTIATYWFHKYTNSKLFLLNFDFYERYKRNIVRNLPMAPVHNPQLDKRYIQSLDRIEFLYTYQ